MIAMKKYILLLLCLAIASGSGCLHQRSASGSFDGLSSDYGNDARILAEQAAEELSRRHAPAHTAIALHRAPGTFGETLEQRLREDGFALNPSGLEVSYSLDVMDGNGTPALGYAQIRCSDGELFSMTREVVKGLDAPVEDKQPVSSRPLPGYPSADTQALPSKEPAVKTPDPAPVAAQAPQVKTYPVRKTGTAAVIARRNRVPVKDFCRWNCVGANATLMKGYQVYLSEPPAGTIPVAAPVPVPEHIEPVSAPTPVPAPAVLPTKAQMSPSLTLEKPQPGKPVPYTPISATPPVPGSNPPAPEKPAEVPAATPAVVMPAVSTTLVTPVEMPVWEIHKREMLRSTMEGWAAVAGYSLIWNAQHDYEMRSDATFRGEFLDAVKHFFAALQANGLALRVTIYQGNKVMEVSEH